MFGFTPDAKIGPSLLARKVGCTHITLLNEIAAGRLKCHHHDNGQRYFTATEVHDWLELRERLGLQRFDPFKESRRGRPSRAQTLLHQNPDMTLGQLVDAYLNEGLAADSAVKAWEAHCRTRLPVHGARLAPPVVALTFSDRYLMELGQFSEPVE